MSGRKLIRGGLIYDGRGGPPFRGDIRIRGGYIEAVLPGGGTTSEDAEVIDAAGLAVTPGFVDTHRHCDFAALTDPDFGRLELAQGITTALCGNCGLTPFPAASGGWQAWYGYLEPCLGESGGQWFPDTAAYLGALGRRPLPLNLGAMVGLGAVKSAAMELAGSGDPLPMARSLLEAALEQGAVGVSSGIMYLPECHWSTRAYIELLRPLASSIPILTVHIRGEGDSLVASVVEVLEIARQTGVPLNISHFKAVGRQNWNRAIHEAIALVEGAGLDVTADFYPYTGGATTMLSLLPPALTSQGLPALLRQISTAGGVRAVGRALEEDHLGWDNMVRAIGWERIHIGAVGAAADQPHMGRSVAEAAADSGQEPVELLCRLLAEGEGKVGAVLMSMHPADVDTVARLPWSSVISDALYGDMRHPHPRLYGAFPRALGDLVGRGILPMEEAVRKMTDQPAQRFGLRGRGRIEAGCHADLNLFDPAELRDNATYTAPTATGMDTVLVNGEVAWRQGSTLSRNGAIL